jgi:hypothetical protein
VLLSDFLVMVWIATTLLPSRLGNSRRNILLLSSNINSNQQLDEFTFQCFA